MSRLEYEKLGIGVNVKDKGLKGDGVSDDVTALNALITSIGSAPTDVYFPSGTFKLGANVTQPSNIRFIMANGAMFSGVLGTETLTLNGGFEAGLFKVFDNILVAGTPKIEHVYPEWWGVTEINSTSAFNKMLSSFPGGFLNVQFQNKTYLLTGNIQGIGNLTLQGKTDTKIIYYGSFVFTSVNNITIKNINFESTGGVSMIEFTSCANINIEGCTLDGKGFIGETPQTANSANQGIGITSCIDVNIINNTIYNMETGKGIECVGSSRIYIHGNYVHHTGRAGISISSTNNQSMVSFNTLEYNVINFTTADGAIDLYGPLNVDTIIINNKVSNWGRSGYNSIGIRIKGSENTICENNSLYCGAYSYSMIFVQERNGSFDKNVYISKNKLFFQDNTYSQYGIRVTEAINIHIVANVLKFTGTQISDTQTGIELRTSVINGFINDNIIVKDDDTKASIGSGISLNNTVVNNFKNIQIKGNTLHTTGVSILVLNSLGVIVESNIIYVTNADCVNFTDSNDVVIAMNFIYGSTLARIVLSGTYDAERIINVNNLFKVTG